MPLPMRRLGQGLEVSCIGYGCMGNTVSESCSLQHAAARA